MGVKKYVGFCLGKVRQLAVGIVRSRFDARFPELLALARRLMRSHDPRFKYTSVQVNKNMACRPHRDAGNEGPSYIIGLGDYTGGRLVVWDDAGKQQRIDIRNRFFRFDGRKLHAVEPFKGERYSLVFFTVKKHANER